MGGDQLGRVPRRQRLHGPRLGPQPGADLLGGQIGAGARRGSRPHPGSPPRDRDTLGAGDDVQVVAGARGVEHVSRQHRIRGDARQRQPALAQQHLQRLGVVDVLGERGVGEHRRQRRQRLRLREAGRSAQVAVAEREVGAPLAGGEGEADQVGADRRRPVEERRDRHRPYRLDVREQRRQRRPIRDGVDRRRHGGQRQRLRHHDRGRGRFGVRRDRRRPARRELIDQAGKLELAEQRAQPGLVRVDPVQLRQGLRERHVLAQPHQLARDPDRVARLDDRLPPLAFDLPRPGQQRVEIAVLVDELGGGLGADTGDARDVVDAVAHQRQHVADLLGPDAELLAHLGRAKHAVLHRVENHDAVTAELQQVLVRRADHDVHPGRHAHPGQRGDEIVSLEAGGLDLGQPERVHHPPHHPQLGR